MKGPAQAGLFGDQPNQKRNYGAPEAAALCEVLLVLRNHPAVAWVERQNNGAIKVGQRFVRFGWRGCSDLLGQLKDGRLLACEVKAKSGRLRPEQAIFLERVRHYGGTAFVARNANDVMAALGRLEDNQ